MPRKGAVPKRDVLPDPVYGNKTVTRFINKVMLDGKKGVAQTIVYDAFATVAAKTEQDPLKVFEEALENIMPVLEVKARRVGGSTYQVPMEVRPERRQTLGLRWLIGFARKRSERTMAERLAAEIMDAKNNAGGAFKKKEETYNLEKKYIGVLESFQTLLGNLSDMGNSPVVKDSIKNINQILSKQGFEALDYTEEAKGLFNVKEDGINTVEQFTPAIIKKNASKVSLILKGDVVVPTKK